MTAPAWTSKLLAMLDQWSPAPEAMVLVGSHARGEATPWSDIDLVCVGDGPGHAFRMTELGPVSWTFGSAARHQGNMMSPAGCGQVVPAWRDALVLHDPRGRARELQEFAQRWTWDDLDPAPEAWAAGEIPGYAEEVLKLKRAMAAKDWTNGRVQASLLAVHLAPLVASGTRTFFPSENHLWHLLADQLGSSWRADQEAALAAGGEEPEFSCAAAIRLFGTACEMFEHEMSEEQRRVFRYALDFEG